MAELTTPADPPAPALTAGPMAAAYRLVTVALVMLTTMIAFEAMAVTTAMPRAAEQLGAVGSYGLAFSSMLTAMLLGNVLAGSWADRVGALPGLYAGQLLFAAGSLGCALAPTWPVLLGGRVVAGLGAGLVVVTEFVTVGRFYPAAVRPQVFTWLSAAWVVPSIIGAPVAGWLTTTWSWRWVFGVVLVPAAIAAALVTARRAELGRRHTDVTDANDSTEDADTLARDRADHRRAARLGLAVALSAGAVQLAIHEQDGSRWWPVPLAIAGLLGIAGTAPRLLPAGTLRAARGLPAVVLSRALFNASFMASVTFLPLLLVLVHRLELTAAGAVVAAGAIGWSVGSWLQGRRTATGPAGRARLVWLGALALTVGTIGLTVAAATSAPVLAHTVAVVACGLGMGIGSTTLSVLVLDLAPGHEHGRASAALQLADVLGSVLGIAGATALFSTRYAAGDAGVFVVIEAALAVVAAIAVVTGMRCAPSGLVD